MNYLYIICLALSSLFTYKPLSAETHPLQYAFLSREVPFSKIHVSRISV